MSTLTYNLKITDGDSFIYPRNTEIDFVKKAFIKSDDFASGEVIIDLTDVTPTSLVLIRASSEVTLKIGDGTSVITISDTTEFFLASGGIDNLTVQNEDPDTDVSVMVYIWTKGV